MRNDVIFFFYLRVSFNSLNIIHLIKTPAIVNQNTNTNKFNILEEKLHRNS